MASHFATKWFIFLRRPSLSQRVTWRASQVPYDVMTHGATEQQCKMNLRRNQTTVWAQPEINFAKRDFSELRSVTFHINYVISSFYRVKKKQTVTLIHFSRLKVSTGVHVDSLFTMVPIHSSATVGNSAPGLRLGSLDRSMMSEITSCSR